eukprot:CAMPEP_0196815218 /NCGR_PEP_ID=MMETSP1362-20130617/48418_1 /TAXON_ID=163516 /ORGANISM="Leptocylindrus danicus, Strain CCMP1856" /LENGTH=553 /DNA_ID=CAMNT_0042192085 /DNA_START=207 /DNA_END=1868 /DNA_ORIENTATION=-
MTLPSPSTPTSPNTNGTSAGASALTENRYNHRRGVTSVRSNNPYAVAHTTTTPRKPTTEPLPLPKNLVLLSLMESSAMASAANKESSTGEGSSSANDNDNDNEGPGSASAYDSEDDYAKVQAGVEIVNGTCGTYVVVDQAGLVVLPSKPEDDDDLMDSVGGRRLLVDDSEHVVPNYMKNTKQDVHQPSDTKGNNRGSSNARKKKLFSFGKNTKSSSSSSKNNNSKGSGEKESGTNTANTSQASSSPSPIMPLVLNYGDRVQIVEMKEDGWATLARKRGYLYADGKQLVKVGGPEDKACRLEAMLLTLAQQKRDALKEQSDLSNKAKILQKHLKSCMREDYPICTSAPATPPFNEEEDVTAIANAFTDASSPPLAAESFDAASHASPQPTIANQIDDKGITRTPPPPVDTSNVAPNSAPVEGAHAHHPGRDQHQMEPSSPSSLFSSFFGYNRPASIPHSPSATSQVSNTSASSLPASGELLNITLNRSAGSSASANNKVSFRTGMSGHRGLSRTRGASSQGRTCMRMSDHRGLGSTRKVHRTSSYDDDESWTTR